MPAPAKRPELRVVPTAAAQPAKTVATAKPKRDVARPTARKATAPKSAAAKPAARKTTARGTSRRKAA
jgi:hypothetical protein